MIKKIFCSLMAVITFMFAGCTESVDPVLEDPEIQEMIIEEIYESLKEDETSEESYNMIQGTSDKDFVYCRDFFDYYNGACVPVAIINNMKILEDTQGIDIIESNETDRDLYKELVKTCKTERDGSTIISDMLEGIQETFDDRNIDLEVSYFEYDIFDNIKKEIDNNKPLIMGDTKEGIEHAYTVIGYTEDATGKYVITFTGWVESPYETVKLDEENQIFVYYK